MTEFYGVVDQIIENLLDLSDIGIDGITLRVECMEFLWLLSLQRK